MTTDNNSREHKTIYLTVAQVAELLGLKESRIRNMIFKRQIPYLKVGASIRFNKSQVIEWLNSKFVEAGE